MEEEVDLTIEQKPLQLSRSSSLTRIYTDLTQS